MYPELSYLDITKKLEVLRTKQRQINIEIANLEEMKSRKLSEEFINWNLYQSRKKDIYDPYPTVRF
ncbi:hypothetical protein HUB98_05640 [Paenibacillus barcinonensis]|uniref:Uncharacterized protein n=1 Tax=Paenibacillus barcinonensis TaxID=198119 RepID=A0A2V4VEI0_PAEBA|nr:hypothetical protein [Paenibacillus barcinonensis]PYE51474.1 hypothetical protein DFQ00_102268 [Paenibacillus barcinonensis]QKS55863.1 hypothetical protein HUB98_05640 [Paenibacillus barcinonensis]